VAGERSILLLEPEPYRSPRKLLTPPFHGDRPRAYGNPGIALARQAMAGLSAEERLDARERMQEITWGPSSQGLRPE